MDMDQGIQIDVVYTDFEKAFDKVLHQGLISTLEAYNLNNTLLLWIQDFLCNRKQRIIVNGTYSQWYRYHIVLEIKIANTQYKKWTLLKTSEYFLIHN